MLRPAAAWARFPQPRPLRLLLPPLCPLRPPPQVGVLKARQLAARHRLPLVPVHHMEAHALVARLGAAPPAAGEPADADAAALAPADAAAADAADAADAAAADSQVEFPFLCLLISGGHNLLLLVEGVGRYTQLGTTLDDALGGWPFCLLA